MGNAQQPNGSLTYWRNFTRSSKSCIPIQGARRLLGVAQYWDAKRLLQCALGCGMTMLMFACIAAGFSTDIYRPTLSPI